MFRQLRIPYVLIGLQSFYRNPVINALIALLRALVAPDDDEHLRAVLSIFAAHVDAGIVDALTTARRERGCGSLWALLTVAQGGIVSNFYDDVISQVELNVPLIGPMRYHQIADVARLILRLQRGLPTVTDFHSFIQSIRTIANFDDRFPQQRRLEDYETLFMVFADHLSENLNTGLSIAEILSQAALLDEPLRIWTNWKGY